MLRKPFHFLLSICLGLATAGAQEPAPAADPAAKTVSLTISPFHLASPVFELTAEYALSRKFGVGLIGGGGSMDMERSRGFAVETVPIPVMEIGAQAAYYVVGSFRHGMQLGGELIWLKIFPPDEEGISVTANGIAVGPMVGYKWAARFGLTLMAQLGYQFLFAQAEAEDSTGQQAEASGETGIPLLNLNAGWSF